jgi:hypothetical protein
MPTKTKAAVMDEPEVIEQEYEDAPEPEFEIEDADYSESDPDEADPLTGEELLAFHDEKAAQGMSLKDIAYMAGYFSVTKTGQERVNSTAFKDALLEAKGIAVGGKRSGGGRGHAGLSRARVSGSGILLVSQLAVRNVDAGPGAVFSVSYPGDGQILLTPTGEVTPIVRRKGSAEEPGTPLVDAIED